MNLNILFIEDNENELFNIIRVLKKSGVNLNHHVLVDCAEDLINALKSDVKWDVILSDFNIPGFGGEQALEICNTASGDIPFILVSGIVGEETAVSLIKSGAKDYVMKDNLSRLPESIKREIKDAQLIKERNDLIIKSNKLSQIVESSHDIILNFDIEQNITYFNKEADVVFKFSNSNQISLAQIIDQDWDNFFQTEVLVDLNKWGVWKGELYFKTSELTDLPVIASIVQHQKSEFNEFSLIAIDISERKAHEKEIIELNAGLEETIKIRTAELSKTNDDLKLKNKEITDSIKYAKYLQNSILPTDNYIKKLFPESFIFYKPKDIVSGDFYWFEKSGDKILFASVDCTGHGVPGAFMSILGNNFLNLAVTFFGLEKPNLILNKLNNQISKALKQSSTSGTTDGMDISFCAYDPKSKILEYAGAYNDLWLVRNGKFEEIKADRHPIGLFLNEEFQNFKNNEINIEEGDIIYLFTDGYSDQFGGPKSKKFKYRQLKEKLLYISDKPMEEQKEILEKTFEAWRGDLEQVDDVLIMGIKL